MADKFPRRNRLDLNTLAEKSILNAIQEVEKVGSSSKLTDIVVMLIKTKDLLSDYIEEELEKESLRQYPSIVVDDIVYWYDKNFEWMENEWYKKPALILFEKTQKANLIFLNYKNGDLFKYCYNHLSGSSAACMEKPFLIVAQSKPTFGNVPII